MFVIATAGHVDHGKSALVRALTGMEPDRWAEERRRGMTIDLGYVWMVLPGGTELAFVDVPGHERFATNMLAGLGPVPAVLLVVAADSGWSAQTEEHAAAIAALGVDHVLLAVSRSDLADPAAALTGARRELRRHGLTAREAVVTSAVTGAGLDELTAALQRLVGALPEPDTGPDRRIRLWVDRAFTVRGVGTVVTGTLGAGRLRTGQTYQLAGSAGGREVNIRGLQRLGAAAEEVAALARVAVNLRGVDRAQVRRGDTLLTPGAWVSCREFDAEVHPAPASGSPVERRSDLDTPAAGRAAPAGAAEGESAASLPRELVVHLGSAAVTARVRPLGGSPGARHVRLRLATPLPLTIGDRALLRDPGRRRVLGAATVVDPDPPPLHRRGAAAARAQLLARTPGLSDPGVEVARRGAIRRDRLVALGCPVHAGEQLPGVVAAGGWLVAEPVWRGWQAALHRVVVPGAGQPAADPRGVSRGEALRLVGLPDAGLLEALLASLPGLQAVSGRLRAVGSTPTLPARLAAPIAALQARFREQPFQAPESDDLLRLGLRHADLAAARDAGAVLLLPGDVVLPADAPREAAVRLAALAQPFTISAARQALGTTRRVAVPLLEHLDSAGVTQRLDASLRRVRTA